MRSNGIKSAYDHGMDIIVFISGSEMCISEAARLTGLSIDDFDVIDGLEWCMVDLCPSFDLECLEYQLELERDWSIDLDF